MVQAVELTFDRSTDDRVRAEWSTLQEAGLPSLADHAGATNQPHATVHVRDELDEIAEGRLGVVATQLPVACWVGGVLLFHARRRWVVSRQLVVDRALLDLHDAVTSAVGGGGSPLTLPGRWVPHVTLARGVRDEQLPAVLERLDDTPPYAAAAVCLRRWDQTARRAWDVGQTSAGRSL